MKVPAKPQQAPQRPQLPESVQMVGPHDFLLLSEQLEQPGQTRADLRTWARWRENWITEHGQQALLTAWNVSGGKSVLGIVPQWEMRQSSKEIQTTIRLFWQHWEIALESRTLRSQGSEPTRLSGWIVYRWVADTLGGENDDLMVLGKRAEEFAQCGELSEAIARAVGGYVTDTLMSKAKPQLPTVDPSQWND